MDFEGSMTLVEEKDPGTKPLPCGCIQRQAAPEARVECKLE